MIFDARLLWEAPAPRPQAPQANPPHWCRADAPDALVEAQVWSPWLQEPGSLTQRLRLHRPPVHVQPLAEGVQSPHPRESALLGWSHTESQVAWVREVQLMGAGVPRLWARTVMPHGSARNPWAQVQTLGQQPLGELLFVWPDIVRGPLYVAHTPFGWARYCVYHRDQAPLLLVEVFLPALLEP